MQLHADLSLAVAVDSRALPWVPSPMPGVERRMLDRDGEEVARATSLVRYAPGSSFAAHTHGAGEEFLVLEGVFSDETGDFPQGWYVRNPPGSRHVPASAPGAVIFVKLRQMPTAEVTAVRQDTNDPGIWRDADLGVREAVLFEAPWERVVMRQLPGSYRGEIESWPGGAECLIVAGELQLDGITHGVGAWLRQPADSNGAFSSRGGALFYCKTGHLG